MDNQTPVIGWLRARHNLTSALSALRLSTVVCVSVSRKHATAHNGALVRSP